MVCGFQRYPNSDRLQVLNSLVHCLQVTLEQSYVLVGHNLHVSHSEPMPQTWSILSNSQKFVNVSCYQTSQDLQWCRKLDWTNRNLRNQYLLTVTIIKSSVKNGNVWAVECKAFAIKTQTESFNSKVQHFCLSIFYILKTISSVLREETLQTTLLLSDILS